MLNARNYISEEYYKAEHYLQDKKFKKLILEKSAWDLDTALLKDKGIEADKALNNPDIARRFMFTEVE